MSARSKIDPLGKGEGTRHSQQLVLTSAERAEPSFAHVANTSAETNRARSTGFSAVTRDTPRQDVFDYTELFYNRTRKHTSNGMLSPVDYEIKQQ